MEAVDRLHEYFLPRTSILAERRRLFQSQQSVGQTATEWACMVRRMVDKCKFPAEYVEQAMRDVFIFGIQHKGIAERLMDIDIDNLNFANAQSRAETMERARRDVG